MIYKKLSHFLSSHTDVFSDFKDREERLDGIVRYRNIEKKLFPTTLRSHQHQVASYVAQFLEDCGESFEGIIDQEKALVMAWIHDDLELFMKNGDIPSSGESQRSAKIKEMVEEDEQYGIKEATKYFPKYVNGYVYEDLLWDAGKELYSLEAQVVKFCDKMVGLGEALHEIERGNFVFLQGPYDEMIDANTPSPKEYYARYVGEISHRLPLFSEIVKEKNVSLCDPFYSENDYEERYEFWKRALMRYAPQWEVKRLAIER